MPIEDAQEYLEKDIFVISDNCPVGPSETDVLIGIKNGYKTYKYLDEQKPGEKQMCDLANQQLMLATIDEKVLNEEMFSAYDITIAARKKGMSERHSDVKNEVHTAYNQGVMGEYTRTLVDFMPKQGSSPMSAWVYHLPEDDPWEHPNAVKSSSSNQIDDDDVPSVAVDDLEEEEEEEEDNDSSSGIGAIGHSNGSSNGSNGSKQKKRITASGGEVDNHGRVRICQKPLKEAGFSAGQVIHVTGDGNNLLIGPSDPHGKSVKYKIDQYTNARISLGRFKINGTKFSVARNGNAIKVTVS